MRLKSPAITQSSNSAVKIHQPSNKTQFLGGVRGTIDISDMKVLVVLPAKNLTVIAYELDCTTVPSNRLLFQTVGSPPEEPIDGAKANLLRFLGQNILMYMLSKSSLYVS